MRVFRAAACAFVIAASAACSGHWFAPSGGAIGSPSYGIVTQTWSPELARWSGDLGTGWVRLDVNWFETPQTGNCDDPVSWALYTKDKGLWTPAKVATTSSRVRSSDGNSVSTAAIR